MRCKAAFIRVWLGRRLHADDIGYAQTRGNARWARFWVAVLVQVLGLGAMKVSDKRRARKGQVGFKSGLKERRLSSGSGGVFMQVPQPNHSRVETRVGLGSGSRCWYGARTWSDESQTLSQR